MPSLPLTPEKAAEAQVLAQAIREAVAAEIDELADTLVTTDDQHLFGANEFKLRDLAHRIAAKALEQHLARKKTVTRVPASPVRTAATPPNSTRTVRTRRPVSSVPSTTAAPTTSADAAARDGFPSTNRPV
jgi:hypothetical protein